MEAVYRDYKSKDVNFFFVYKSLAHPQNNGFVHPTTLKERLLHAAKAKESLGTTIPWLVDTMDNQLKHALGDRPNSEFVISPEGAIVRMRDWSNAEALREDLTELVGPIENPTDPRSLDLRMDFTPTEVARGVVKRIQRDKPMLAVKVETQTSQDLAYVKLRAEVDESLRGDGKGQLYLGFFMDPIHTAHWNNQAGAVIVEVNGQAHSGPKVDAKADADPREFVIDISMMEPIEVTLKYVACDDKETWCRKLTQTFVVTRELDRDAGRVRSKGNGRGRRGSGEGMRGRRPGGFGGDRRAIGNGQRPVGAGN